MSTTPRPIALVTGASSGIGAALALQLAERGWDLVVTGRRDDRLRAVAGQAEAAGAGVEIVVEDLHDAGGRGRVEAVCRDRPLELLANNAGLGHYMSFADLDGARLDELLAVNVVAPTRLTHAALPGMLRRGRGAIVNVASLLAFSEAVESERLPPRAVYAGAKAYMVSFTRLLATELAGTGVRAMVVLPPIVATDFHTRQGIDLSHLDRMLPETVARAALSGLESGEVVCMPSVEDASPLQARDAAQGTLLSSNQSVDAASRYTETRG